MLGCASFGWAGELAGAGCAFHESVAHCTQGAGVNQLLNQSAALGDEAGKSVLGCASFGWTSELAGAGYAFHESVAHCTQGAGVEALCDSLNQGSSQQ